MSKEDFLARYKGKPAKSTPGDYKRRKKSKKRKVKETRGIGLIDANAGEVTQPGYGYKSDEDENQPQLVIPDEMQDELLRQSSKKSGNSWVTVNNTKQADLSPPRRRQADSSSDDMSPVRNTERDLSPRRRPRRRNLSDSDQSPPRNRARDTDLSPPRNRSRDTDLSPPRNRSRDTDLSPPRNRSRDTDLSPPRKRRTDNDLSPPRKRMERAPQRSRDLSPPRRGRSVRDTDLSPPRRGRRDNDLSPRRRSGIESSSRAGSDRQKRQREPRDDDRRSSKKQKIAKGEQMTSGARAGLWTASDVAQEVKEHREREDARINAKDPKLMGRGAGTVIRDKKSGRKVDHIDAFMRKQEERKKREAEEPRVAWGGGALSDEEASEISDDGKDGYAGVTKNDDRLTERQKRELRWGDPMADLVDDTGKKKRKKDKKKKSKKDKRSSRPFPPNRFNIPPGKYWDGINRSNGFEQSFFMKQAMRVAQATEAHRFSVADDF
eukprot:CAMPEP_0168533710 /NCGR_PEP_ID=MMETSP0405-20121227/17303_1 /TAXON_ID=498012 /ORGANISM="Trichosphaerium sp, Strain Am-I-7 wt" /LENGTH=491 /DNA_ID=CAMNT_0008559951 /DNA_START=46 /DNA_END=1521 /DNA_ORIENTATION=-